MEIKTPSIRKFHENISYEFIIPFIFIIIGLFAAFNHALWRDEMQGWLVAWRSDSLVELWRNNAPSGHPVLWSVLIYLTKNITGTPLSMQLLHWFLGSCSIILFWKCSPFNLREKILFTFGYYPFWEYFFISRHYVISELLIFLFCSSFCLRGKTYLPIAICISLLTNTQALAWSLAFAIASTAIYDWYFNLKQRISYFKNPFWRADLFLSILITLSFSSFGAFSLLQVKESISFGGGILDVRHWFKVLGQVFGGYLLVIPNSSSWPDLIICSFILIILLTSTIIFLKRSKPALVFFISGNSFLFFFNLFLFLGVGSRHYGYYFFITIASAWLALSSNSVSVSTLPVQTNNFFSPGKILSFRNILSFCLAIHLAVGIHMAINDFYVPYSSGRETASYIKEKGWEDYPIFGTRDVEVATVSGYLNRDFYYPELKRKGSFAQWANRIDLERSNTLSEVQLFFSSNPEVKKLLLVLSRGSALPDLKSGDEMSALGLKVIADRSFENSFHSSEHYFLYWVERIN